MKLKVNDKFLYTEDDSIGLVKNKKEWQEIINGSWKEKIYLDIIWFLPEQKIFNDKVNRVYYSDEKAKYIEDNSIVLSDDQFNEYLVELDSLFKEMIEN